MTSLSIATGFERQQGVLKRLGATPLGRGGLLGAKVASTTVVLAVQSLAVSAAAFGLGWRPRAWVPGAVAAGVLGIVAFGAMGLLLAGTLRAEANLGVANGLFLVFLLVGGIVVPTSDLPGPLQKAAEFLPAEPLATSLRDTLSGGHPPGRALLVLALWAGAMTVAAVATFRWE
jgi:ABC-2 type transport system permease protein